MVPNFGFQNLGMLLVMSDQNFRDGNFERGEEMIKISDDEILKG